MIKEAFYELIIYNLILDLEFKDFVNIKTLFVEINNILIFFKSW